MVEQLLQLTRITVATREPLIFCTRFLKGGRVLKSCWLVLYGHMLPLLSSGVSADAEAMHELDLEDRVLTNAMIAAVTAGVCALLLDHCCA